MNKQRLQQARALVDAILAGFDEDDRMHDLREKGREWAEILNANHTPRDVPEILNGLLPFEVAYLCQAVISNSTDHSHASMALTVIANMARHRG